MTHIRAIVPFALCACVLVVGLLGIHVVGSQLYAAQWEWPGEPHDYSHLVYVGHFPVKMPWRARADEPQLPERFHGKIEYEQPPQYRVRLYGADVLVDEPTYLEWIETVERIAERGKREAVRR